MSTEPRQSKQQPKRHATLAAIIPHRDVSAVSIIKKSDLNLLSHPGAQATYKKLYQENSVVCVDGSDNPNFPIIFESDGPNKTLTIYYRRKFKWFGSSWFYSRNLAADQANILLNSPLAEAVKFQTVRYEELTRREYNAKKAGKFNGIPASHLLSKKPQYITAAVTTTLGIGAATALYVLPLVGIFIGFAIPSLGVLAAAVLVSVAVGAIVYKIIDAVRNKIRSRRFQLTEKINEDKKINEKLNKPNTVLTKPPVFSLNGVAEDFQQRSGDEHSAVFTDTGTEAETPSSDSDEPDGQSVKMVPVKTPAYQFNQIYEAFVLGDKKKADQLLVKFFHSLIVQNNDKKEVLEAVINDHAKTYPQSNYVLYKMAVNFGAMKKPKDFSSISQPILSEELAVAIIAPSVSKKFEDMMDEILDIRLTAKQAPELVKSDEINAREVMALHPLISNFVQRLEESKQKVVQPELEQLAAVLVTRHDFVQANEKLKTHLASLEKKFFTNSFISASKAVPKEMSHEKSAKKEDVVQLQALLDEKETALKKKAKDSEINNSQAGHEFLMLLKNKAEEKVDTLVKECVKQIQLKERLDFSKYLDQFSDIKDKRWFLRRLRKAVANSDLYALSVLEQERLSNRINIIEIELVFDSLKHKNASLEALLVDLNVLGFKEKETRNESHDVSRLNIVLDKLLEGKSFDDQIAVLEQIRSKIPYVSHAVSSGMFRPAYTPKQALYLKCLTQKFDEVVEKAERAGKFHALHDRVNASPFRKG